MSDDYDDYEDAEAAMAIEEDEAQRGYYAQQRDLEDAIERAQCDLCGVWLAEHGTDCP